VDYLRSRFGLEGRVAVVTGGTGVLGSAMARALAGAGARVAVLGRRLKAGEEVAAGIEAEGGCALALAADVTDRGSLEAAREAVVGHWGAVHLLVNAAGGNLPGGSLEPEQDLFDLSLEAFQAALELNLLGALRSALVFGRTIADAGGGAVVNVSSMAAERPLTRVAGYGAAKAALENLTRWLAVELGRRHGGRIRVNAVAPGFFIGNQNRSLLVAPDGSPTARGQAVLAHTPAGRFGQPDEVGAAVVWLCGKGASFVNGAVVPVDGGFSAFGGV
jgi:NAD(P)-dependent dehydrogenase (short-subunit alcohol dehydrogenase family)